ncbi:uncharacterized protein BJX67DRAFT_355253 [Aspergillus lucknowensis]|uniref:Uncharacterized protein n=1 Tax=Aspergillus lucknowensis TaxID=176173 RepID=A0ABR4LPZ7_9EURO
MITLTRPSEPLASIPTSIPQPPSTWDDWVQCRLHRGGRRGKSIVLPANLGIIYSLYGKCLTPQAGIYHGSLETVVVALALSGAVLTMKTISTFTGENEGLMVAIMCGAADIECHLRGLSKYARHSQWDGEMCPRVVELYRTLRQNSSRT